MKNIDPEQHYFYERKARSEGHIYIAGGDAGEQTGFQGILCLRTS